MKRLLLFLLVLSVSVVIGLFAKDDPGYILLTWHSWVVESSLLLFTVTILLIFIGLSLSWKLLSKVGHLPKDIGAWHSHYANKKANHQLLHGLVRLAEGDWAKAEQELQKNISRSESPLLNQLACAIAAQQTGSFNKRNNYLIKAVEVEGSELAVGLTQAKLQIANKEQEQALASLNLLQQQFPNNSAVLFELANLQVELKNWQELILMLPKLRKSKPNIPKKNEKIDKLEQVALLATLELSENKKDLSDLNIAWSKVPNKLKRLLPFVVSYCRSLTMLGSDSEVEQLLREAVERDGIKWQLIDIYSSPSNDDGLLERISQVERWLEKSPENALLLLALGRLGARNRVWGKARESLEASLKRDKNAITYAELARLQEKIGDTSAALESYRHGLELVLKDGSKQ